MNFRQAYLRDSNYAHSRLRSEQGGDKTDEQISYFQRELQADTIRVGLFGFLCAIFAQRNQKQDQLTDHAWRELVRARHAVPLLLSVAGITPATTASKKLSSEDQPESEFQLAPSLFGSIPAEIHAVEVVHGTEAVQVVK